MGEESSSKHSKGSRSHEKDPDRKSKKKRKHDDDGGKKHKHKKVKEASSSKLTVVDDDPDDEDMWVEKNIDMDGERVLATDIPTANSLKLTSSATAGPSAPALPPSLTTESKRQRDDWMLAPQSAPTIPRDTPGTSKLPVLDDESYTDDYGDTTDGKRTLGGGVDFFSSLGTEHKKKDPKANKPDPDKPIIHHKELNRALLLNTNPIITPDRPVSPPPPPPKSTPGGPGSQWRMMRLKRVYETAEEEGTPVEKLAMERFGSLEAFEEAKEERRILDERQGRRSSGGSGGGHGERGRVQEQRSGGGGGEKRLMFNDIGGSGGSSRSSSFRRPGAMGERQQSAPGTPSTPSPPSGAAPPANRRLDSLRLPSQAGSPLAQSHTPIPSVMTPQPLAVRKGGKRGLSPSSLNRLQAKVLRAKLMGAPDADKLEKEYEVEARRAAGGGGGGGDDDEVRVRLGEGRDDDDMDVDGDREDLDVDARGGVVRRKVEVLPTLDGRGRLYDVGHGKEDDRAQGPGNRKKKEKFETHDPKTGQIIRYNADDDTTTLGEMLRQERFGAGMADQKNLDAQFASAIMGDGKFQNDLDYIDDNAEKLGRQKMRSDAMKRQFAIGDYKRTQKAMASCSYCFGEDDAPPKAPVVAMGTRVYLACTTTEELVKGHCLIVPIQHHLNMLEGDDDVWDEVRNFMKCLMRMFAEEDQGVIFYETVISLKWQKHTVIECVPLPWEQYEIMPGYFKESILASEAEWSQHKKLIDFSARPGGFRRAMVPNLPYFMVQFDHKGEKGYGHVIEGVSGNNVEEDENGMDEGEKGGGEFPSYFAGEIIGNVLEVEARRWRRPRRIDFRSNAERVKAFRMKYDKFDWTGMIGRE